MLKLAALVDAMSALRGPRRRGRSVVEDEESAAEEVSHIRLCVALPSALCAWAFGLAWAVLEGAMNAPHGPRLREQSAVEDEELVVEEAPAVDCLCPRRR